MSRDATAQTCEVCHTEFMATQPASTCSPRCRQRKHRGTYVVTDEDRAAIRRVLDRDGCGHPLDRPLTADEVARHVALTAVRT